MKLCLLLVLLAGAPQLHHVVNADKGWEVLDREGDVIDGLYAAGRTSSGIHGWGYISGTSLGDGTFFGRRAGRAAARHVR